MKREHATLLLQPISYQNIDFEEDIINQIQEFYGFNVIVAKSIQVPQSFVNYEKGFRYSASDILDYLGVIKTDDHSLVLGITATDIFVSKKDKYRNIKKPENKYRVWGIMGLAKRPGVAAVVSTKRLQNASKQKYKERLLKVILHEIGHNLGLKHCEDKKCLMTDAVEKVSTIDHALLGLCSNCSRQIGN
ncbi:MAG: matrixin family metalloprotease [Flavipsychrobacter sp.]